MKLKLLIATNDVDYTEHLSQVLSKQHADTFLVDVCSTPERLQELLETQRYDIALVDTSVGPKEELHLARLPILLWDEVTEVPDMLASLKTIRKYQRISHIVGQILEQYAALGDRFVSAATEQAQIYAFWSPAGGVGKTTTALAYATRRANEEKQVTYLDLEHFSSTKAFFSESGGSISKAFEKLESNVEVLLQGLRQQDSATGISYFCGPENYDDMHVLSAQEMETLVNACTKGIDILVLDLSSVCDDKVQRMLQIADRVFLVLDPSITARVKLKQFMEQHNVYGKIRMKTMLLANKGAQKGKNSDEPTICLPQIAANDPVEIYKMLSAYRFDV